MNIVIIGVALLAGWCGTPYPIRWPIPWPIPIPDPPPCWVCRNIISAISGLVLTFGISQFTQEPMTIVTAGVLGFLGGRFGGDIAEGIKGRPGKIGNQMID